MLFLEYQTVEDQRPKWERSSEPIQDRHGANTIRLQISQHIVPETLLGHLPPWLVLLQSASAWDLLLLVVSSVEKPGDLLCVDSQAKSRFRTANPSMSRIPTPIWAASLARNVQTRPNTNGPQTVPRRATRLESALAAPIVS